MRRMLRTAGFFFIAACSSGQLPVGGDRDASADGARLDGGAAGDGSMPSTCGADASAADQTFAPSSYDHTCSLDTDCAIAGEISPVPQPNLGRCELGCCSPAAVRDTPALRAAQDRATQACCSSFAVCTKACPPVHAACVLGTCTVVDDAQAGDGGTVDAKSD
jgi:hypothetical protein